MGLSRVQIIAHVRRDVMRRFDDQCLIGHYQYVTMLSFTSAQLFTVGFHMPAYSYRCLNIDFVSSRCSSSKLSPISQAYVLLNYSLPLSLCVFLYIHRGCVCVSRLFYQLRCEDIAKLGVLYTALRVRLGLSPDNVRSVSSLLCLSLFMLIQCLIALY